MRTKKTLSLQTRPCSRCAGGLVHVARLIPCLHTQTAQTQWPVLINVIRRVVLEITVSGALKRTSVGSFGDRASEAHPSCRLRKLAGTRGPATMALSVGSPGPNIIASGGRSRPESGEDSFQGGGRCTAGKKTKSIFRRLGRCIAGHGMFRQSATGR